MLDILLPIFFFALTIYSLRRLSSLLSARRLAGYHRLSQPDPGWKLEWTGSTVSLYTTSFNSLPKAIVSSWKATASGKRLYNLGVIAGAIGGTIAIGGSLWAVVEVWKAVWWEARLHAGERIVAGGGIRDGVGGLGGLGAVGALGKRAMDVLDLESIPDDPIQSLSGGIQPLIPGVTVPLSHLPTLVLALFLNQLIHEAGHALAAALDDISPSKFSFNLHILIPSMIVSFPSTIDSLPIISKLRLAASGPWHNLLTYLFIWCLAFTGLGRMFWKDISAKGRVVNSIDPLSPLFAHISPGHIITHLDDVFLGGREDIWTSYLEGTEVGDEHRGWCIDKRTYDALSIPPCTGQSELTFRRTIPSNTAGIQSRCLPPHPILDVPSGPCPCPNSKWVCVRPSADEQILRIQLGSKSRKSEKVILWSGDRRGVLEAIHVGTEGPRLLGSMVRWGTMFLQYMSAIAFSLFMFNLLPLPHTDGSHLLRGLLALVPSRHSRHNPTPTQKPFQATLTSPAGRASTPMINLYKEYELSDDDDDDADDSGGRAESGGGGGGGWGGRREERWKRRVRRGVEIGLIGALAGWAGGWAMLALLRSS